MCVDARITFDSTYGPRSRGEFGGIGMFVGPSKWDSMPGGRFDATDRIS